MTTTPVPRPFRILERHDRVLRFMMCAAGLLVIVVIGVVFAAFSSWDLVWFLIASSIFVAALCAVQPYSRAAALSDKRAFLLAGLVIWTFVMLSEAIFVHFGSTNTAESGQFSTTAYFEAISWMLSILALAFITLFRPAYIFRFFKGPLKWASIFTIIAVLSCPLSPNMVYSLSMAFKLCVVVLTLFAIAEASEDAGTVPTLFVALFVGIGTLTFSGFVTPFLEPGSAFVGAGDLLRFGPDIGMSGTAGILLLLCLLFFLLKKNPWFLGAAGFALAFMVLVGGKGGIVATIISFAMFFVFLRNARQALMACLAFAVIFGFLVAFTPLGHVLERYSESTNSGNLSGRMNLWSAVWPEITHKPIFGHGYRASRFISSEVEGTFAEAGHVHNVVMEILYNNGILGLLPVLAMNYFIVANLGYVLKQPGTLETRYYAAAALALYIHLIVWGITAPTFGSMADHRFMTFFFILLIGIELRKASLRQAPAEEAV